MASDAKTTVDLIVALHKRYPQAQGKWANVIEFQNIDFLSVACWPSLKYIVHGHEIKASRSDWLRELKDPFKSLYPKAMCDMWWLVAPQGVAKEEELPEGWGFLEWNGYSFWMVRKATLLRPPFQRDTLSHGPHGGANLDHFARKSFAMMARRYAYAQSDRNALLAAVDEPRPYLDRAAMATGRATNEQREAEKEWRTQQRQWRKESRELAERQRHQ